MTLHSNSDVDGAGDGDGERIDSSAAVTVTATATATATASAPSPSAGGAVRSPDHDGPDDTRAAVTVTVPRAHAADVIASPVGAIVRQYFTVVTSHSGLCSLPLSGQVHTVPLISCDQHRTCHLTLTYRTSLFCSLPFRNEGDLHLFCLFLRCCSKCCSLCLGWFFVTSFSPLQYMHDV